MTGAAPIRLVRAGGGETISDGSSRTVRITADHPALAMTESRFASGERGAPLHVHRGHADAWWVLDGELTFVYGSPHALGETTVRTGGFVLVPPMLPHTLENRGSDDARFLNLHARAAGFPAYLRARRDGRRRDAERFDQLDPPEEGCGPATAAVILHSGEGRGLELGPGQRTVIKCGRADGLGTLTLAESLIPPGFPAPLPHLHRELLDAFYVLDGILDMLLGAVWVQAEPGDLALVPPGNVHTVVNRGSVPVRVLNIATPGGYERYLIEVADERARGGSPDPARMAEIAARYDFVAAV